MPALPPRADIQIMIPGQAPANVRSYPESGRKWAWRWMSAFDPKRTSSQLSVRRIANYPFAVALPHGSLCLTWLPACTHPTYPERATNVLGLKELVRRESKMRVQIPGRNVLGWLLFLPAISLMALPGSSFAKLAPDQASEKALAELCQTILNTSELPA